MKKEWNTLRTSIMFFTRIPVGIVENYSDDFLNSGSKYLPIIGWIAGGLSGLVFYGSNLILPTSLSVLFAMVASILLTGAFHEDGFADVCDGFGGGWTKERILTIMKDSRIGAYGMIGMFFMLLAKYTALIHIDALYLPFVFIIGHTFSRYWSVHFIYTHNYVRDDITSKAKPLGKKLKTSEFILAIGITAVTFLIFPSYYIFFTIPTVFFVYYFFARYIKKWIGGYTGDCLGAMQQLTELGFYLSVVILNEIITLSV
jgi:adenosylcobinamide-GDP ribazoletransferase